MHRPLIADTIGLLYQTPGNDWHHIEAAKGDGGSFDADLQVVRFVNHGVLGVIGDRPEYVRKQQPIGVTAGTSFQSAANAIGMPKPKGDAQVGSG